MEFSLRKKEMLIRASLKMLLFMNLTAIFLVIGCMHVSAAVFSQRLVLSVRDVPLTSVFRSIEKQSSYTFFYDNRLIRNTGNVSVEFRDGTIRQLMDKVLEDQPLTYEILDKIIVIRTKENIRPRPEKSSAFVYKPLEPPAPGIRRTSPENSRPVSSILKDRVIAVAPPEITVRGKVTDEKGEGIAGVSVVIKGTNRGVITSADGDYTLQVPDEKAVLVFTIVGYTGQEVTVGNRTRVDVTLQLDEQKLEEVVVVGYGTQKKANLTGAVGSVGAEVLENRPVPNLTQGLQGVLPNVNIRMLDGKPNQSPSINVRGATSIGQGGSALILIDGVEGDPSMINPGDVESVTILKDAASAAIYGARAAFGVVLITTKRPVKDNFSVTYNVNYSSKKPTVMPNFVTDGYQWAKMFNDSFYAWEGTYPQAVNKTLPFSQEYLAELERRSKDPSLPKTEIGPNGNYVYYENTDWYDLLYKDNLSAIEHNLTLSRSTDKASFMITGRYNGQEGLFRYNSDDFSVYNIRAKGSMQLFRWLEISNNFDFSNRKYHNPLNVGEGGGIWRNIADEGHVLAPMLNPDGTITFSGAYTVGDFFYGKNGIDTERSIIRNMTSFESRFLNNTLRVIGNATFQNTYNDETRRRVRVPYSRSPGVIEYVGQSYDDLREYSNRTNYIATNLWGEYERTLGKHYFKVMAGTNYERSVYDRLEVQRNGLVFDDATNINLALGQSITTSGNYEAWNILGGFSRINYIYGDRYLFEFNGRYDGSSKFPDNERFAFFPSVSVGWRISGEPFWKISPKTVSDLKVRWSYGSLGNGSIGSYAFQQTFDISQSGRILNGIRPQRTSRPSVLPDGLTWETATTSNIGLDLAMFANRLNLNFDAYTRKTTDMYTIGMTLPATFGATSPRGNYADMETKGWEVVVTWNSRVSLGRKQLNYRLGFNLADNKSKILRYNNPNKFLNDYYVGQTLGEMWGYKTDGFFKDAEDIKNHADQSRYLSTARGEILPGDIKLKDLNGDGVISPGDNTVDSPGDRFIIGNNRARYTYGINLGADYGGFFVSAFFQGVGRQDWYPSTESNTFWGLYNRPYGDVPQWHLKEGIIWTPENPDAFFPRFVTRLANRSGAVLTYPQTQYVMNVAYLRLKNVQVGYNLPSAMLQKTKAIKSARIFLSGENLLTWSPLLKIVDNVDVENANAPSDQLFTDSNAGDGYNYPMLKAITIGLTVTF